MTNEFADQHDLNYVTYLKTNVPVIIYPYNPLWPCLYEKEKEIIKRTAGPCLLSIEHIGSTSVPGLMSKDIIDIIAGVADKTAADECQKLLLSAGYDSVKDLDHPEWFYRLGKRLSGAYCHLHIVKENSEHQRKHIDFRDWLCNHPEDAKAYEQIKIDLAKKYRNDRLGYTNAKCDFIERILEKCMMHYSVAIVASRRPDA